MHREADEYLEPLLAVVRANPELATRYMDLIEPLRLYDREHHGDLVRTLRAYLQSGGNAIRTADALYLHRNSLRYRMSRIKALLSLDLDDHRSRLLLQLALLLVGEC